MGFDETLKHWTARFDDLLSCAEKRNKLYYFLNIYGWGSVASGIVFLQQLAQLTNELILVPIAGNGPGLRPHDIVFLIQLSYEAKPFYAKLRNFVYLITDKRHFRDAPWRKDEVRPKHSHVELITARIIENLSDELREVGFNDIAEELLVTHTGTTRNIRNSAAHCTFVLPNEGNGMSWNFAQYSLQSDTRTISVTPSEYSQRYMKSHCERFFGFRLGFHAALQQRLVRHSGERFSCESENRMKQGEMIPWEFDRGTIKISFTGTFFW